MAERKTPLLVKLLVVFIVITGTLVLGIEFGIFKPTPQRDASLKSEPAKTIPKNNISLDSIGETIIEDVSFPDNFFFGTASSDFQTTGGNGLSDWESYISKCIDSKKCRPKSSPPFVGPDEGTDFLNRYKEDFDLAQKFNNQIHRISLEWARIEPEEGKWDLVAIEKYKEIIRYMKYRGIEPMICLNHFTSPKWFAELGGWENNKAPYYYARYASFLAKKLGIPLKIKWWLTFNEPQFVISIPYAKGGWPPDKPVKDLRDTEGTHRFMLVASNVMDGHRLAYRAIHKALDGKIGKQIMASFASAPGAFYPHNPDSTLDQLATNVFDVVYTMSFDSFIGNTDRDFIGLNYYGQTELKLHVSLASNILPWLNDTQPLAVEWVQPNQIQQGKRPKKFTPKALYDLIMKFKPFGLPIVITENGLHDPEDKFREEFLVLHLKAVHDAIRDGANVIGYQYWALTDTWEWDGFFSQMGLIGIDRNNNFERKLMPSAITYGEIIRARKITKELLEKYKELLN